MLAPPDTVTAILPPPSTQIDDASLFFDFDGTLVELAATPDGVVVGSGVVDRLDALAARLPGRIAIVSGRSIAQLDGLLGADATRFVLVGSHGAEQRLAGARIAAPSRPAALAPVDDHLSAFAADHGLVFERKSLGAALHFRAVPERAEAAALLARRLAEAQGLVVQHGKMMVEVRVAGDKGAAIERLLALPGFAGTRPLFFGDDVTDEDGFAAAARAGGAGVLIGAMRATQALYRLDDVAALAAWMEAAAR